MQDTETLVYKALNADGTLITLLGGKTQVGNEYWNRIYNGQSAPNTDEFSRVTLFEVVNDDSDPADDASQFSDVNIRIDLWTKDDACIYKICKQIKNTLKSTFTCTVRLENKIYESDTKVYHKPINVYLIIEQGE
jgi:hypothetical protein